MDQRIRLFGIAPLATFLLLLVLLPISAEARKLGYTEQLPLETFKELREVERYQLQVAEKAYLKETWESAANEYEKYLTLYEASAAAPYAQLMWSHCQVHLRQSNTALRDGFQSVIDYWPGSHEATLAAYLMGRVNKDIGNVKKAQVFYNAVLEDFPKHRVAFFATVDLLELARTRGDEATRVRLLKQIVFETESADWSRHAIGESAKELAGLSMRLGNFTDGKNALEKIFKGGDLLKQIQHHAYHGTAHLRKTEGTRAKGGDLADKAVSYLKDALPADISDEGPRQRARQIWFWIANLQGVAGRGEQRLKTYQEMTKRFGVDDDILNHIAEWYKGAKRYDEVEKIYLKFEDDIRGLKSIAHLRRELGKRKEAIEFYRQLVVRDPDNAGGGKGYLWAIADCYRELGDLPKAIQTYRQTDNVPESYFAMAHCHRKLKQYKEALVLYNQAKSFDNYRPRATLDIGFTYEESGQREKAIRTFQSTCKTFPKTGQASRAHAHLQNKYKISVTLGGATDK